jgi:hypothetical protein
MPGGQWCLKAEWQWLHAGGRPPTWTRNGGCPQELTCLQCLSLEGPRDRLNHPRFLRWVQSLGTERALDTSPNGLPRNENVTDSLSEEGGAGQEALTGQRALSDGCLV